MESETGKLLNVLRHIARAAGKAAWGKDDPEANRFCVGQYNRVLARLTELEPAIKPLFSPMSETSSAQATGIAAKGLLAYFEPEAPELCWSFALPMCGSPGRSRVKSKRISVSY